MTKNKRHSDFDEISDHFSKTRQKHPWPELYYFAQKVEDGDKILDLGCGNGRFLEVLKDKKTDYLGIDQSKELLKIAKEKYPEKDFKLMNMEKLDLEDETFDKAFAIASLHHLETGAKRIEALKEARRILKNKGRLYLTVWNLWQPKYRKYIYREFLLSLLTFNPKALGDSFIPWKDTQGNLVKKRYYYAYALKGLEKDLNTTGFKIIKLEDNGRNFLAVVEKA